MLQLCHSQITRISVLGQGSGTGPATVAAQGEIDGCGDLDARLGQLADELAARITRGQLIPEQQAG
jgi:hypothetical protein